MAINRKEFINRMAENGHVTKKSCREYLDLMLDTFYGFLEEGETVKFHGIMSAEAKTAPERVARNPQNGEECIVPEHRRIKIKVSETVLRELNEQKD